jgi:hypothetical protein
MLFALCDLQTLIEVQHIHAAMEWIRHGVESAKFVFVKATDAADSVRTNAVAKKIVEFLRIKGTATQWQITTECFQGHLRLRAWAAEGFKNSRIFFNASESLRLHYFNVGNGPSTPENVCFSLTFLLPLRLLVNESMPMWQCGAWQSIRQEGRAFLRGDRSAR